MGKQRSVGVWLGFVAAVAMASAVGWFGGQGGSLQLGLPVLFWCAALAFAVQWTAFVPAYLLRTERFYDLVGSLTYLGVTAFALATANAVGLRAAILGALVAIWAIRLGTFLVRRVRATGKDGRFDEIKTSAPRFLQAWTLQGLWVFLTLCAALAAIGAREPAPLGALDFIGVAIWTAGFVIEVVADRQKSRHRACAPGRFIATGLWAWSRHPNYFGEIVLWVGVAVIAASTLRGWAWITLLSPVFVLLLLTRGSGIPLLERRADQRWGEEEAYQRYKARTPALIPRPPRR